MAWTYDNQDWARVNNGRIELKNADGSWSVAGTPEHAESLGYVTTAANSPEVDKLIAYARAGGALNAEQQSFLANPLLGMDSYGQGSRWGGALDLFDNQFSPQQAGALSISGLSSYLTPEQLASGQQFVQQESPAAQSARDDDGGLFGGDFGTLLTLAALGFGGYSLLSGLGGAGASAGAGLAEGFGGAGMLGDSAIWGLGDAAAAGTAGSGAMDWSNLGDLWDFGGGGAEFAPQNVVDLFNNAGMEGFNNYGQSFEELAAELFNNAGTPGFDQYGNEATGLDWIKSQFGGPGSTTSTATNALKTLFGGSGGGLTGTGGGTDWMKLLGGLGAAGLGAYASNKQTSALEDMAGRYEGYGAPYRQKLSDLYANPDSFLQSNEVQKPVQQGTNILMRSLSMQGNPFGSGNALQQGQNYASDQLFSKLGQEKDRLAGFGGLANYNAAAPGAATNAIGSSGNTYNAIGSGLGNIFNPPKTEAQTMADFMKAMKG